MGDTTRWAFPIPGTQAELIYERDESGRLVALSCDGRQYLLDQDGRRSLGDGLAVMSERIADRTLRREVEAGGERWTETYTWDEGGHLVMVDGVEVRRDERGRVTACLGPQGSWYYGYAGDALAAIHSPHGVRHLTAGEKGRPLRARMGTEVCEFAYDAGGMRLEADRQPGAWNRDALGRLWTVGGPKGTIRTTYLWDGYACLGRIDGPPGDPLAAVFCLDPSGTPVRVITHQGVTVVPRDAFGEGLLAHPGVPGLYGGATHAGLVYLPARALDPRSGAYCAPDPLHGKAGDPRRAQGYRGPLPAETAGGPYAVSQNDPVGRTDPTGNSSFTTFLVVLSDLTWSLQNNLIGWLTMDFTLNFWFALLLSPFSSLFAGLRGDSFIGRFFSFSGLSSDRSGSFGVRRDGLFADHQVNPLNERAWTFQHIVWASSDSIAQLEDATLVDPQGEFRPQLYASLLHVRPDDGDPFVLRGTQSPGGVVNADRPTGWSRAGGSAEAVIPGSLTPHFPRGGLHFDGGVLRIGLRGNQPARLREMVASSGLGIGTLQERLAVIVESTGVGINTGDLLLLVDDTGYAVIAPVLTIRLEGSHTRILLDATDATLGTSGIRLRGLGAAASTENLNSGGVQLLKTDGSSAPYAQGDPLRLSQGGQVVGAVTVQRLEAQVSLDAALPDDFHPDLTVAVASTTGTVQQAQKTGDKTIDFTNSTTKPGRGSALVARSGGTSLAVMVTREVDANVREVDRSLASLGASLDWQPLNAGAPLGVRQGERETGLSLTYQPAAVRTAPSSGFLSVTDRDGKAAVRTVTGLNYDALATPLPLPGNTANPYQVERFPFQAPNLTGARTEREQSLGFASPANLNGEALQVQQLTDTSLAAAGASAGAIAGLSGLSASGATVTKTYLAGATLPNNLKPPMLVLLTGSGDPAPAVITGLRAGIKLDRNLTVSSTGLELVLLGDGSPDYTAQRQDLRVVTVLPQVGGARVEMPAFAVGELVKTVWTGPTAGTSSHRVSAVDGTTLTLEGGSDLPAGVTGLTLTRLVPVNPQTGSSRIGIEGVPVGGTPAGGKQTTDILQFKLWSADDPTGDPHVAVIDGMDVLPAICDSGAARTVEITFGDPPAAAGPFDIKAPSISTTAYAAAFTQDSPTAVTLRFQSSGPLAPGANLVAVFPYRESDRDTAKVDGRLSPGTVRLPDEPEGVELDRRQSLIDHELTHTLQSARWGPLLLGWFPMWAVELGVDLGTNTGLPEYSAYVSATVEVEGANRFLRIPDAHGVPFAANDTIQVSKGGLPVTVVLGAADAGGRFGLPSDRTELSGQVQIRRVQSGGGWETLMDVLQFFTHGGLMNIVTGSTWGGVILLFGKLFYALGRWIGGAGDTYPAAVEQEGRALRLGDDAGRNALRGASRLTVQKGDSTLVRSVESINEGLVLLQSAVSLTGDVRVAPYSTHTPGSHWDWHDYFPATVPDPTRPAAIQVFPVGDQTLSLSVFDRLTVSSGETSVRATVTAVNGDIVELDKVIHTRLDTTNDYRVAKVGHDDPFGNADSAGMAETGMDWMRWLLDPYGQLYFQTQPTRGSFWDVVARMGRYLFGTQSWSLLPAAGYAFWFNMFRQWFQWPTPDYESPMEQEASEQSGDLYTPIGRLRGALDFSGDIARYWYFLLSRSGTSIATGLQDAPGVHILAHIRVLPSQDTSIPNNSEPNQGAQAPPGSGVQTPDVLFQKNLAAPLDPPPVIPPGSFPGDPPGYSPADRGWIPNSPALQRSMGAYVAFTQPGTHRVTVANGIVGADDGRQAQQSGAQALFFVKTVGDVGVNVAGRLVAENQAVTLVQAQRARVAVTPDADRRYKVMLTRPAGGDRLRSEDDLILAAQSQNATGEFADVARIYHFDPASGGFDASGLNHHGLHLPGDLAIPVRRFTVDVVDTLAVRSRIPSAADLQGDLALDLAAINDLRPGEEGFVLVPAAIFTPLQRSGALTYTAAPVPPASDPQVDLTSETVADDRRAFIGDGGIIKLRIDPGAPPEETAAAVFTLQAGTAASHPTLTARVNLVPHFRLERAGGGTNYQVSRGGTLDLGPSDGVTPVSPQVQLAANPAAPVAGVAVAINGTQVRVSVDAAAPLGLYWVLAGDSAHTERVARRTIEVIA